jgi:hypothetical protein
VRLLAVLTLLLGWLAPATNARADDGPSLTIEFRRHPPASLPFSGYRMMLIGEADRRGTQRTVIGERPDGTRETLAWWNDEVGRWVTADGQHWEDVRAHAPVRAQPPAAAGVADFGVWRVKAIVLDPVEASTPPAYTLRIVDEPAVGSRAAFHQAAVWCRDGVGTRISEDENEEGLAFYPAHRVQKCEAYPAQ